MDYDIFPDVSLGVSRTHQQVPFQKRSYSPKETMYGVVNTGATFVNGRGSYLVLDVVKGFSNDSHDEKFTSALNFIKHLRLTDRSNNEIEHIRDLNIINNLLRVGKSGDDWLQSYGTTCSPFQTAPLDPDAEEAEAPGIQLIDNGGALNRWMIPLRLLSDLFDREQLLPPQLMNGLRIELELETTERVVMHQVFSGTDYQVTNCYMMFDTCKLTDSITRHLNLQAANEGIEIQFRSCHTTTSNSSNAQVSLESSKAVTRAFGAVCHIKTEAKSGADFYSLSADEWEVLEHQWRAGSLYYPQQPIVDDPTTSIQGHESHFRLLQYL